MAHQRQVIRQAVKDRLVAANTAAQDRVFTTREVPWKRIELPGIAVYAVEETVEDHRTLPRELARTLTLAIVGVTSLTEDVDNALDDLAEQIETAIHADPSFGLEADGVDAFLASTQIEVVEEQGRPMGAVRLTYAVRYFTSAAPA